MMTDNETTWLTLQQAAALAGCSTKTLYRLMARKRLAFRQGADHRRYLREADVRALFPVPRPPAHGTPAQPLAQLQRGIAALLVVLRYQTRLLEQAIALYQPKTLEELVAKRTVTRSNTRD